MTKKEKQMWNDLEAWIRKHKIFELKIQTQSGGFMVIGGKMAGMGTGLPEAAQDAVNPPRGATF